MSMIAHVHSWESLISRGQVTQLIQQHQMHNSNITLEQYNDKICVWIESKVHALMKNDEYQTKSAFTQSALSHNAVVGGDRHGR